MTTSWFVATSVHENRLQFHEKLDKMQVSESLNSMEQILMANLQVKGIDDRLYRALSERAARDNRSISQEVVTILQSYLNRPLESPEEATRAFLALAGSWSDERSAKEIAADIRKSRRNRARNRSTRFVLD